MPYGANVGQPELAGQFREPLNALFRQSGSGGRMAKKESDQMLDHLLRWCAHRWREDEFDSRIGPFCEWYLGQLRDDPTLDSISLPMMADIWEKSVL